MNQNIPQIQQFLQKYDEKLPIPTFAQCSYNYRLSESSIIVTVDPASFMIAISSIITPYPCALPPLFPEAHRLVETLTLFHFFHDTQKRKQKFSRNSLHENM